MKNSSTLIAIIFIFSIFLFSCKKDSLTTNQNDLTGTNWVNQSSTNGLNVNEKITFTNTSNYTDVLVLTGTTNTTYTMNGTYVYTPPSIKFTPSSGATVTATINGTNLYMPSLNGTATVTYVKQ